MDIDLQSAEIRVHGSEEGGTLAAFTEHTQRSEPTEQSAFSETALQRRVDAITQGVLRRLRARSGIWPERLELVYLLEDDTATSNADALRRWIHRQLANAPDLRFSDQIAHIHRRLDDVIAEAQW